MRKCFLSLIMLVAFLTGLFYQVSVYSFTIKTIAPTASPSDVASPSPTMKPVVAGEFEGVVSPNFHNKVLINKYTGSRDATEIVIPSEIDGIPVVGLSAVPEYRDLFRNMRQLEKVTIPDSVYHISGEAFMDCHSLKTVIGLEQNIEYNISYTAFLATPWYEEKVKSSRDGIVMFGTTVVDLKSAKGEVHIPEGATLMQRGVFSKYTRTDAGIDYDANVSAINIPSSMTNISYDVLEYMNNLKEINVHKNNPEYYSIKGVLYKDDDILVYPKGKRAKKYVVPENVKSIYGLSSDFIEQVFFEGTTIKIGDRAFVGCKKLKKITLPKNAELGIKVFEGTKLKKIHLTKNTVCGYEGDYYLDYYEGSYGDYYSASSSEMNLNSVDLKMDIAPPYDCCVSTFSGCTDLKKITVSKKNKAYIVKDGALYYRMMTESGELFYLIGYPAARNAKTLNVMDGATRVFTLQDAKNLTTIALPYSVNAVYFDNRDNIADHIKTIKYEGTSEDWNNEVLFGGGRAKWFVEGYSIDLSHVKMIYNAKSIEKAKIKGIKSQYKFSGEKIKPTPIVKVKRKKSFKKLAKKCYNVTYKTNKNVGKATVTISGKGKYYGKITKTFKIVK